MGNTVITQCRADPSKFCKNWDGKGDVYKAEKAIECPENTKHCSYSVTPKPSAPLR